jgi:site-specific DNA-methyltransferase (adenine-specific)
MQKIENKIIYADVLDGMKQIPDDSVSLVFSSPPYSLGLSYDNHSDDMSHKDYIAWLENVFTECKRVLKRGGRLAINVATITNRQADKDKEYFRFAAKHFGNMMDRIGLFPFAEIIWYKQDAAGKKTAWGSYCAPSFPIIRSTHEYIFVFSKDQFRLDGDIEQSDMTPEEFQEWTFSTWFVKPETRNLVDHPAPFSESLAGRVIKLFSYRGDLVLDPFNGTGTTTYMAYKLGRRYLGIDNSKKYCDFAINRIEKAKEEESLELDVESYVPRSKRLEEYKKIKHLTENMIQGIPEIDEI